MPNGMVPKRLRVGKYRFVDVSKARTMTVELGDYPALKEMMTAFESAEHDGFDLKAMNSFFAVFYRPAETK